MLKIILKNKILYKLLVYCYRMNMLNFTRIYHKKFNIREYNCIALPSNAMSSNEKLINQMDSLKRIIYLKTCNFVKAVFAIKQSEHLINDVIISLVSDWLSG